MIECRRVDMYNPRCVYLKRMLGADGGAGWRSRLTLFIPALSYAQDTAEPLTKRWQVYYSWAGESPRKES